MKGGSEVVLAGSSNREKTGRNRAGYHAVCLEGKFAEKLRKHSFLDLLTNGKPGIDKLWAFPLQLACMQSSSRPS